MRTISPVSYTHLISLGIVIYGAALLLTGSLTRDELELVPRIGSRLVELAERWRLLR